MRCVKSLEAFNCNDWETWKTNVRERIAVAHRFGIPEETIKTIAVEVGDFLSEKICPAIEQEEPLKAMWSLATPDERKTLATLILKWFDQELGETATKKINPSTPQPKGLVSRVATDRRLPTPL